MSQIKVLFLVPPHKTPGRVAAYSFLEEEVHALAKAGVEVYLISPNAEQDHTDGRVHLKALPSGASFAERRRTLAFLAAHARLIPGANLLDFRECYHAARLERFAADVVRREDIDVIHSHFGWPSGCGGLLAGAATKTPVIASFRGNDLLLDPSINYGARREPFYDRAVRRLLRDAQITLLFSEFMRGEAVRLGAPAAATRVVKKGVDLGHFRVAADKAALRAQLGLTERPLILTVAGLIPRKGINHVLEALARLKSAHDFSFVVCGEGPERERLETLSKQLGLEERTKFVGKVERRLIPDFFAACDVFVLASLVEAAGNVLLEAMASGCPVICTDSGGPPEYVRDQDTGFVVPVSDPGALAEKIKTLLAQPALGETMGARGREFAAQQYPYARMVEDLRQAYLDAARFPAPRGEFAATSVVSA